MKIVLTGATGFIGKELCPKLKEKGNSLVVLTRDIHKAKKRLGDLVVAVEWDAKTLGDWVKYVDGSDAVINLTGESIGGESIIPSRWTKSKKEKIVNSRVDSTRVIVSAIKKAQSKPKVLINASAVGYYGHVEEDDVTESYKAGNDFLAETSKKWEIEAANAENLGLRVVRMRSGIVLAKHGGAFRRLIIPFRFFIGGTFGSGKQWFPWVHLQDEINAFIFSLENEKINGAVNVSAPQIVRMKEFCKALGNAMKRPSIIPVPSFALKIALGEMSDLLLKGQKVIPEKLLENGYKFLFPEIEAALNNILQKI